MEIRPSARRHGIADADIEHAWTHAMWTLDDDDSFTMHIGADRHGRLLEIGSIFAADGETLIIHAMPARAKFLR